MSDCHRGDGSLADDFLKNQTLYFAALTYYNKEKYTYIELGDGDELWKNKSISAIMNYHSDVFWLLSEFYNDGRLYFIYGNHDMVKDKNSFIGKKMTGYFDKNKSCRVELFNKINVYEALVLRQRRSSNRLFLIHGHQVDLLNSRFWKLSRFLVRYLWRPLETFGINDPTSAAKNYTKNVKVDARLALWANKEKRILIAGHTHKPHFPQPGDSLYFNDGSCVHPRCITGIEISEGNIALIKWSQKTRDDGTLYVGRDIIAGPQKIEDYFNQGFFAV